MKEKMKAFLFRNVFLNGTNIAEDLIKAGLLLPETDFIEAYFISEWLHDKLKEKEEEVMETRYGYIWFRCSYGLLLEDEIVLQEIADEEK